MLCYLSYQYRQETNVTILKPLSEDNEEQLPSAVIFKQKLVLSPLNHNLFLLVCLGYIIKQKQRRIQASNTLKGPASDLVSSQL